MITALTLGIWSWLERLGGVGLILLGFADNSPIPIPGGMDALTVILAAQQKSWWPYYAVMATIGGIAGGYATYALAREGGKEELEKKLTKSRAQKAYRAFNRFGFWSLFIPALLPPPCPFSPFVIAAGALNYPRKKFLSAVAGARGIRYFALAYLGSRYSREIFGFFHTYYQPILWTLLGVTLAGVVFAIIYFLRKKRSRKSRASTKRPVVKAA